MSYTHIGNYTYTCNTCGERYQTKRYKVIFPPGHKQSLGCATTAYFEEYDQEQEIEHRKHLATHGGTLYPDGCYIGPAHYNRTREPMESEH